MSKKTKLKTAKRCWNCEYFYHEYEQDGYCLHEEQNRRRVNSALICGLYKKKDKKKLKG